ncbi:MAG TPA: hypothetical protein VLA82_14900 [Actinomycetota bacterium]|nr:hypothetical protein [Actinomycetota bacterium]
MTHERGAGADVDPGDPRSKMASTTSDPGHPQPEAAEVESARLLFNETRDRLTGEGLSDDDVRRLAGEYVALDLAGDAGTADSFVAWVRQRRGSRSS